MQRYLGWMLAFVLGLSTGWLADSPVSTAHTTVEDAALRRLLERETAVLARTRAASDATPADFANATAYAVRLLRVLEHRRLVDPTPPGRSEERELDAALERCEWAASTESEEDLAAGLQLRATALLRQ